MMSAIIGNGQTTWPGPNTTMPTLLNTMDWQQYMEVVKRAKEYDAKTNQPNCEDPKKVEWLEEMNKRVTGIEQSLKEILEKIG